MPDPTLSFIGAMIVGLPAYVVLWLVLRRQARAIFLFALVLLGLGIGYLSATGTTADIGRQAMAVVQGPATAPTPAK